MNSQLLLLADSRLPAGGHAHSGGLEPAVTTGTVTDLAELADFLRGRLATTGLVTAALTAAACAHATNATARASSTEHDLVGVPPDTGVRPRDHRKGGETAGLAEGWARLDAEVDARTPSPAQRKASRAQGRALLRAARGTWPHPALDSLVTASRPGGGNEPHHPIVLGAATAAAGGTPEQAAMIAAYGSVTGPASAAVRLLGLDPLAVHRALADLAPRVDAVAAQAAARSGDWAALPALSAPGLDLLAESHLRMEPRLFES